MSRASNGRPWGTTGFDTAGNNANSSSGEEWEPEQRINLYTGQWRSTGVNAMVKEECKCFAEQLKSTLHTKENDGRMWNKRCFASHVELQWGVDLPMHICARKNRHVYWQYQYSYTFKAGPLSQAQRTNCQESRLSHILPKRVKVLRYAREWANVLDFWISLRI